MQEIPHILGFTAGELTPWLATRYDLQAYQRGAARISNFIVQPYGGIRRRNGAAFVAESGAGAEDAVKLCPFSYSENDALMLEFFPGGMRVYREGAMLTAGGEPYVLEVPWRSAEQILSLRFTQVNDAVYVTCPTYRPVVLYRQTDTDWRCEEPDFEPFPRVTYVEHRGAISMRREPNSSEVTLQLPEDSELTFTPEMAGREYVVLEADTAEKTLFRNVAFKPSVAPLPNLQTERCFKTLVYYTTDSATGCYRFWTCCRQYSPAAYSGSDDPADYPAHFMAGALWQDWSELMLEVCGDWELRTDGTWNAQLELWRTYDHPDAERVLNASNHASMLTPYLNGYPDWDWQCVKSFGQSKYSERQNWALTGTEPRPCRMCVVCREADTTTLNSMLFFRKFRSSREYKFLITEVTDAYTAKAKALTAYLDFPCELSSRKWSFGAFGEYNGYPAFSSYSGGRLWFGGMRRSPTTLIGSVVDDFHNFRVSSEDDSALHLTIASDNQSRICWMTPTRQMLIGTSDGVWVLGGGDGSGVLTPSNASFRRQTSVGCENQHALAVENCVLFPQRGGKRLREISYKLESDGFAASDVSLLAEHLLTAGVREYAVQEGRGSYVWAVFRDGTAAVLTLHPEQQVTAWQRVEIPGCRILHVAALPQAGSEQDELWLVVQRGEGAPLTLQRLCAENPYLDDSFTAAADAEGALSVPLRLAGLPLCLLGAGGEVQSAVADAEGRIGGLAAGASYTVGVPFRSELETLPMESVASFNSVRELSRFRLRLYESGLSFEYKSTLAERWEQSEPERYHLRVPYSGSLRLAQMPEAGVGQGLCIRCSGTEDFRLLGLTQEVDHHGK